MQKIEKAAVAHQSNDNRKSTSVVSSTVRSNSTRAPRLTNTQEFLKEIRSARQLSEKDLSIMINARG